MDVNSHLNRTKRFALRIIKMFAALPKTVETQVIGRQALRSGTAFAIVLLLCISSAAAKEQLGVAVYPGSEYDQARTKLLKDSLSVQGAAYRTRDGLAKVTAFYRKQGLVFLRFGSSEKIARFMKYDTDIEVVIQNPWKDAKTGAMMTDTLILIYKKDGKGNEPDISI
jgi:hypothetical protein